MEGGPYLAERIPGADIVELPGDDDLIMEHGDPRPLLDEIERFIGDGQHGGSRDRPGARDRPVHRIVGSTDKAAELGDNAWRELSAATP